MDGPLVKSECCYAGSRSELGTRACTFHLPPCLSGWDSAGESPLGRRGTEGRYAIRTTLCGHWFVSECFPSDQVPFSSRTDAESDPAVALAGTDPLIGL